MLYRIINNKAVLWNGEAIGDTQYPMDIEVLWTEPALLAIGLYFPVTPPVPEGKRVVDYTVALVSGTPTKVYVLEDIPVPSPIDFPLRPDQFYAIVDIYGLTETIQASIEAIPDETERKIALAKLRYTPVFYRNHPLFALLKGAIGMTDEQIDTMWMQAKDI